MPTRPLATLLPITEAELAVGDAGRGRVLEATLIVAGLSRNGTFYPTETLREAAPRFAGLKCYIDHGPADLGADRGPARSLTDLVGEVESAWFAEDRIRGRIRLTQSQPWLTQLLHEGLAGDLSITALGETCLKALDGRLCRVVEAIATPLSVDFVTEGAAGGHIERLLQEQVDWDKALALLNEEISDGGWSAAPTHAQDEIRARTLRFLLD